MKRKISKHDFPNMLLKAAAKRKKEAGLCNRPLFRTKCYECMVCIQRKKQAALLMSPEWHLWQILQDAQ